MGEVTFSRLSWGERIRSVKGTVPVRPPACVPVAAWLSLLPSPSGGHWLWGPTCARPSGTGCSPWRIALPLPARGAVGKVGAGPAVG